MLCGLLLRTLFRNVMSHDAAADRSNDRVVACIMSGYSAHDRAFQAAGGVCCSRCR